MLTILKTYNTKDLVLNNEKVDDGKYLEAKFFIPKKYFKNANAPMGHIIAAQKTSWIREYAESVWKDEIEKQFRIIAMEPKSLKKIETSERVLGLINKTDDLEKKLKDIRVERKIHDDRHDEIRQYKLLIRTLKKNNNNNDELSRLKDIVYDYEKEEQELKIAAKNVRSLKAHWKTNNNKEINKELRRVAKEKRKDYISKKLNINKSQQLFTTCHALVLCQNVTDHTFDASNFSPTFKSIADGGTDTGVLWYDDNNSILLSTTFAKGKIKDKDNYVLQVFIFDNVCQLANKITEELSNGNEILR